jgi:hypothetical protein
MRSAKGAEEFIVEYKEEFGFRIAGKEIKRFVKEKKSKAQVAVNDWQDLGAVFESRRHAGSLKNTKDI